MTLREIATKLEGWNTVSDVSKRLKVKRSSAYVYLTQLNKHGFILQKIKRPRGTMYQISNIPAASKHFGMYENTEFVAPELEFSKKEIIPEHKIAFFLSEYKKEHNRRHYESAMKLIRQIKNWKKLYEYLKVYNVVKDFSEVYILARKSIKKIPRMPVRYKKLLGMKNVS